MQTFTEFYKQNKNTRRFSCGFTTEKIDFSAFRVYVMWNA